MTSKHIILSYTLQNIILFTIILLHTKYFNTHSVVFTTILQLHR